MKLYFAGPYYSQAERQFNLGLVKKLEAIGLEVFLPQRDGVDQSQVMAADVFFIVLDGRVPDEGAVLELGMAYAQKQLNQKEKLIVGYQTDKHAAFLNAKINPSLNKALDFISGHEKELVDYLKSFTYSRGKVRLV